MVGRASRYVTLVSVLLMVGNVAPGGSNLVVSDLTAQIVLPPGADAVVGSGDDPLRMASTRFVLVSLILPAACPNSS